MNPLEDNLRLYKVVDGKRLRPALGSSEDLTVRTEEWHTLKVTMKGTHIECFLDGKKLVEANDDTFRDAGKVGLWSKADAQSYFDQLTIKGK
jgi:hypothetical protein